MKNLFALKRLNTFLLSFLFIFILTSLPLKATEQEEPGDSNPSLLLSLPQEVQYHICSYLPNIDLFRNYGPVSVTTSKIAIEEFQNRELNKEGKDSLIYSAEGLVELFKKGFVPRSLVLSNIIWSPEQFSLSKAIRFFFSKIFGTDNEEGLDFTNLKLCKIEATKIVGLTIPLKFINFMGSFQGVTSLNLNGLILEPDKLKHLSTSIKKMTKLESLTIGIPLTDCPDFFSGVSLPKLRSLDLGLCGLVSNHLKDIGNYTSLEELNLMNNHNVGQSIDALSQLTKLVKLRLPLTAMQSLSFTVHHPHLEELDMSYCSSLPLNSISDFSSLLHLKNLRVFKVVREQGRLSPHLKEEIAGSIPQLTIIDADEVEE